ncbi:GNAT family N-acetyltransferase [Sphingomonas flavalba]|uniref:GNAT family N-acetyltransferase n=1 Tax=Sphingomonas flavalba TaxID=2559804 RepID=UPI0039E06CDA
MWVKGEYFDDLDAVAATARATLDRPAQLSPFDRLEWFRRIWACCPPGAAPLVVRTRTDGADAWLFLARQGRGRLVALASWYTLAFAPAYSGAPDPPLKRRLLRAIARRLRVASLGIARITLSPVPADEAALLAGAFRRAGWLALSTPATVNWRLPVGGRVFAEYWADRPGALRTTVERKQGRVATRILDRFDADAWAAYEQVHAASGKPEEGAPAFLRGFAEDEGAAGTLRLGLAEVDGRPVAAQFWTVENGTAVIHTLAHVEDAAEHSPGTLLSAALFAHAIDIDGVQTIDFGTGDDSDKADWMEERQLLYHVDLFNLRRLSAWPGAARARLSALVGRRRVD